MAKTFSEILEKIGGMKAGRIRAMNAISFVGDIHIYGVWSGVSTKFTTDYLKDNKVDYNKMFGFDSFIGLPEEKKGYTAHPGHLPGKYSSADLFESNINTTMKIIEEGIGNDRLKLIPGFYNKTLIKKLIKDYKIQVASYIEMDVDLYVSTIDVLEFVFMNKLISNGTIIYFDDWGATEEYKGGESLAWQEKTSEYNIRYKEIYSSGDRPNIMKVFKIIL